MFRYCSLSACESGVSLEKIDLKVNIKSKLILFPFLKHVSDLIVLDSSLRFISMKCLVLFHQNCNIF